MKAHVAGLLAAGLLGLPGQAETARLEASWPAPAGAWRIGEESVVRVTDAVALHDSQSGWRVIGNGENSRQNSGGAAAVEHPVLSLAGETPSEFSQRLVTGLISVRLHTPESATDAASLAMDFNLVDEGVAEGAAPWRLFRADPPAHALEVLAGVRADARVAAADLVVARRVARRGLPDDPLLPYQWHLENQLPSWDGGAPVDLRVDAVWGDFSVDSAGWRGRGVRLGIIDDGIEYTHPEFAGDRIDGAAGKNWNAGAMANGGAQSPADTHGTAVAGLAAANANNAGGVAGVAPSATLVSLRLTAGAHDDAQEAQALGHLSNPRTGANPVGLIHVKNSSWGPVDGRFRLAGPGPLARQALANAVRDGRGGRGTVFVWAAGNGGAVGEDANADGYANNPFVIAVGAMDSTGRVAEYSEGGACLAVVAPSNSEEALPMVTTDRVDRFGFNPPATGDDLDDPAFTSGFGGTSAAAPLVAGVCALMLEANPALGWRDVKEILLLSARRVSPASAAWMTNAAGFKFHPLQGAGLIDAAAATRLAATWVPLGPLTELRASNYQDSKIEDNAEAGLTRRFDIKARRRVEHAVVRFTASHPFRGDLRVTLTSPGGTTSVLAPSYFPFSEDGQANYDQWAFSSLHFWGENSEGVWTLKVADVLKGDEGTYHHAELTLMAAELAPAPVFISPATRSAIVDQPFSHAVLVSSVPAAVTVVGEMPPGCWFDAETATLSGKPDRPGVYPLQFKATTAGGTITQSFALTVLGPYGAWAAASGVPSADLEPDKDPDTDGWSNLLEYTCGGNPAVPDAPSAAQVTVTSGNQPSATFPRSPGRTDVIWQIEYSGDGKTWSVVAESRFGAPVLSLDATRFAVVETAQDAGPSLVTVTDVTEPAPSIGWFRVRVTLDR